MQVDFAVELGRDDETLEFPWQDPAGASHYFDLKRNPELLSDISEAARYPELGEFLHGVNSRSSILETAKCDAWSTTQINPEEEIFGAPWKFGSYVDLVFTDSAARLSFESHDNLVRELARLLNKLPEIPASGEFLIRRCYYHAEGGDGNFGFYVSFYAFGYDDHEEHARKQWTIALKLVENAIRQISATRLS